MKIPRPLLIAVSLLPAAAFAVLAVGLALGLKEDPRALPSVLVGQPLPAFALKPVRAGDVGFANADVQGKVALINVYGSWCGACEVEHPMLMRLARRGVPIFGVDWKDRPEDGARTLLDSGDPYLRVGNDEAGRLGLDLGVTGAPETFVVDRRGVIRFKQVGPITEEIWRDRIAPLMARLEAEGA